MRNFSEDRKAIGGTAASQGFTGQYANEGAPALAPTAKEFPPRFQKGIGPVVGDI